MAKIVSKGTIIQHNIGAGLVTIAQVLSIDHSGAEVETYEASDLSTTGSGKEYANTGWVEGGSVDFEAFFDPGLAGHQAITDDITTPIERAWSITFSDSTTAAFTVAGMGFGFTVAFVFALGFGFAFGLGLDFAFAARPGRVPRPATPSRAAMAALRLQTPAP